MENHEEKLKQLEDRLEEMLRVQRNIADALKKIEDTEPPKGKTRFDLMVELIANVAKGCI